MSDPVNLNKFRKAKDKADKEQRAQENRAKFGRTKAAKNLDQARADKLKKLTDAHRVQDPGKDG
ncbi:MAG: DUF4169 family protein [Hyphomonas sp.]